MATILITGGTGMIGTALTRWVTEKGHEVIILTRDKSRYKNAGAVRYAEWDVNAKTIEPWAIESADHVINLAGAGVADKRWSDKRKKEIEESRVKAGQLIVHAINTIPNKIKSVVNSSGIGWYGPDEENKSARPFIESDPAYHDYLGKTCVKWEDSIQPVQQSGKRLVILRTGIVLSTEGGAFKEFVKPLKFRVASILGSGKQVVSWIHIRDLVNIFLFAIENEKMEGVYNAVAPQPVTNKDLILSIAKARGKFFVPAPVPSFVLKIVLGEMSIEVLKSATVSSRKLVDEGFVFEFPLIAGAVSDLVLGERQSH